MTDAAVIKAIEVLDTDKNGTIEFEEFQVWWNNDNNDVKIGGCAPSLYQWGTTCLIAALRQAHCWRKNFRCYRACRSVGAAVRSPSCHYGDIKHFSA